MALTLPLQTAETVASALSPSLQQRSSRWRAPLKPTAAAQMALALMSAMALALMQGSWKQTKWHGHQMDT
jgi:hypothetical protein